MAVGTTAFAHSAVDGLSFFYVDRSNKKINRYVGRCNYSNDCRYHYRPRDYFADCSSRMATQENTVENPDMDNMPF